MAHVYLAVSPDLPWAIHQGNPRTGSGRGGGFLEQQKQQLQNNHMVLLPELSHMTFKIYQVCMTEPDSTWGRVTHHLLPPSTACSCSETAQTFRSNNNLSFLLSSFLLLLPPPESGVQAACHPICHFPIHPYRSGRTSSSTA